MPLTFENVALLFWLFMTFENAYEVSSRSAYNRPAVVSNVCVCVISLPYARASDAVLVAARLGSERKGAENRRFAAWYRLKNVPLCKISEMSPFINAMTLVCLSRLAQRTQDSTRLSHTTKKAIGNLLTVMSVILGLRLLFVAASVTLAVGSRMIHGFCECITTLWDVLIVSSSLWRWHSIQICPRSTNTKEDTISPPRLSHRGLYRSWLRFLL